MITTILILALSMFATSPAGAKAPVAEAYSMEILVDGVPLPEYAARGKTYIEALEGREYSIRLRNHSNRRIAVALSVDGLNTIDASTTSAEDAAKWILEPYQTLTLEGWQTSSAAARRFFFTTEAKSYGAWLGRTRDLGTISAAVFREKRPKVLIGRELGQALPGAGSPRADGSRLESRESSRRKGSNEATAEADDFAATGIGQRIDHRVQRVAFDAEETPAAVLTVRYEYREALVKLGVLPRHEHGCDDPLVRRERARGFEDTGFAPDPYGPECP